MKDLRRCAAVLVWAWLMASFALAQGVADGEGVTKLPSLSDKSKWPKPVAGNMNYSYVLVDLLEFQRIRGINAFRWDALGW
jgi:hypothetical protein